MKGVNRNFDANSKSEDDEAYIGVQLVEDEDADEAGIYDLDVYLIDYVPTSFATEMPDYMYDAQKPVSTASGVIYSLLNN